MELHLKIIGYCLITLGLVHAVFPKQFNWTEELSSLSIMNRQMMKVHTFFIAFTLLLIGILCLTSAADLIGTTLGKRISLGLGIFWIVRLYVQLFVYSSKTWRGKFFETSVHIFFTIFWTYMSAIFILIYV
jgi:hypothetical protein